MSGRDGVDVIMTTEGSTDVIAAVRASPARLGATSDIAGVATDLFFLDFPFTDPRATIDSHVDAAAEFAADLADRGADDLIAAAAEE